MTGRLGEDVTANVAHIADIPQEIGGDNAPDVFEVRGEVYMSKQDFAALNAAQQEAGGKLFANPAECRRRIAAAKGCQRNGQAALALLGLWVGCG